MGTPVHTGEANLEEYLQRCCDMPDPEKFRPDLVPQTVFWVLNGESTAIGHGAAPSLFERQTAHARWSLRILSPSAEPQIKSRNQLQTLTLRVYIHVYS